VSARLDRPGIFKAKPYEWVVRQAKETKSVGINIGFLVLAEYGMVADEKGESSPQWTSWEDYEPHTVYGTWWIIKKDGKVNQAAVDQLVQCLGWNGDLASVGSQLPPELVVQINVKEEEYDGKVVCKAAWMNPEDYVPGPGGATTEEVAKIAAGYGSLLRAAAAGAAKRVGTPKPAAPAPASSSIAAATSVVSAPAAPLEIDVIAERKEALKQWVNGDAGERGAFIEIAGQLKIPLAGRKIGDLTADEVTRLHRHCIERVPLPEQAPEPEPMTPEEEAAFDGSIPF